MILVTGASGQLGRLVIESLLHKVPAAQIVAAVRNPQSVADFAARGVQVRQADYDQPASLHSAMAGVSKVLLISSSAVGQRIAQHAAVIDAAKQAGVKLLAYTSILRADSSPLPLAAEHKATEELIKESGLPYVFLRNGWYTENYLAGVAPAIQYSALLGCAGEGRIASAARADYAEAAAVVLSSEAAVQPIYELAGDQAYTLTAFAAELAQVSGKPVIYRDLPEADYKAALLGAGLPEGFAGLLAASESGAAKDGLFDDTHQLSSLIGRPTQSWQAQLKAAVAG
ncbi:SDR family oxidoreductase [Uliginosibacterium sediminicola]|uniref:SDR family oxidoreductase n=1 Tax=Uliginosibacterium sediminicola TaxID=2024550 RepID=A0ABU9YTN5_9RHOO